MFWVLWKLCWLGAGLGPKQPGQGRARRMLKAFFGVTSLHTRLRSAYVLRELLRRPCPERVLELGFGEGHLLMALARRYPGSRFTGLELDPAMTEAAHARAARLANAAFLTATLEDRRPEPQGLIFCVDVLEHVHDDQGMLRRFHQALVPGGRLVLHVPKRRSLQRRFFRKFRTHTDPGHVREEYTREELVRLVEEAGFVDCRMSETFGPLGELGFELNSLGWPRPKLQRVIRWATVHALLPLAVLDLLLPKSRGNSLLLEAFTPGATEARP